MRFVFTFVSKHSNRNGQESTQHVEQGYGGLQCPFILTFSALGALLDPCIRREKTLFSPFYCHSTKSKEEMGYNSVFLWGALHVQESHIWTNSPGVDIKAVPLGPG